MELKQIVDEYINEKLVQVILSNPINKETGSKIKIRPVYVKDTFFYQETLYKGTQVFHNNFKEDEIKDRVENNLLSLFRQGEIMTKENKVTILVSKNKKITIKINKNTDVKDIDYSHNREKQYILKEGTPINFLVGLGGQTKAGKIAKNKIDTFHQINRR